MRVLAENAIILTETDIDHVSGGVANQSKYANDWFGLLEKVFQEMMMPKDAPNLFV